METEATTPKRRRRTKQTNRTFEKYGISWANGTTDITIELYCFRHGRTLEEGGLGMAGHFKEVTNILWGENNQHLKFIWHPWAERMLQASCEHKYLAVSGCRNSGKTDFYAVWAIVSFLAYPHDTVVLITSTSLEESRLRVWGRVEKYWAAAQHICGDALPGKLVSSIGKIKFNDPLGQFKGPTSGIHLVAGEKKKEKEISGKMIGIKSEYVLLIADELPELSHAILESAFTNLAGNPNFQLIGIGNPNSIYDPHGVLSTPKNGWASVSPLDDEWETEKGWHIRFDGTKSPNIAAEKTLFRFLPTSQDLTDAITEMGEDSFGFWRMMKAYWCPNGAIATVVSEADIIKFRCDQTKVTWKLGTKPVKLTALDPGFTNGGDRSVRVTADFGEEEGTGKPVLLFGPYEVLHDDVTKKNVPHNFQIANQFRDKSVEEKINPEFAASDDSGAAAFGDIVHVVWSNKVTRVNFGGKASERPISAENKRAKACDKYTNKVTEVWHAIKPYMRSEQIKGINPDFGQELTSRRMRPPTKSGALLKETVEAKPDMRARMGKSPDIADAYLILLDFVRTKYKFRPAGVTNAPVKERVNWKNFRLKCNRSSEQEELDRAA